jgi:hypothetical protein
MPQNSYFEVDTETAVHGQHLLCSHPACRAAGVKFRYCAYCMKPVTKQNFRSRHLHADQAAAQKKIEDNVASQSSSKNQPRKRKSPTLSSHSFSRSDDSEQASDPSLPKKRAAAPHAAKQPETSGALEKKTAKSKDIGGLGRQRKWSNVLAKRPETLENMGAWLTEVFELSNTAGFRVTGNDTNDSISSDDTASSSQNDASQLGGWGNLLKERPEDNEDGALTEWIVKILRASCPHQRENEAKNLLQETKVQVVDAPSSQPKAEAPSEASSYPNDRKE